jgi:alpha-D-ribose 1-methylphosphonate 5-triphosphate synthase subunit PhnH
MTASAAFLLSTLDFETPLWIQQPSGELDDYLRFHCGVPIVSDPGTARFALVTDAAAMPDLSAFDAGSAEYPDRSATLVVQVPRLHGGRRARLSGPGILEPVHIEPSGLRPDFWRQWQRNMAAFPCGVDVLFVCGAQLAGMPRTTKVEV